MKKIFFASVLLISFLSNAISQDTISLKDISEGKFSAEFIEEVVPLSDGISYAMMSEDGKRICKYSFKTGEVLGVLFDVSQVNGENIDKFDGYLISPDEEKIIIATNIQRIYRRSFTADHYIYTIANKNLSHLSDLGSEQTPIWSADSKTIAYVRDNNIFLVRLTYDNAEIQVTKDGKRNEIINGIPDWVNEEEFAFNEAMTFTEDGSMLCWIRYDETNVGTSSLETFGGNNQENDSLAAYPNTYTYKYPKAGGENSLVSVYSYDILSKQTRKMEMDIDEDAYIPRIISSNDPQSIIVYTLNRHQDQLCIYSFNPKSTLGKLLIRESASKYVKENIIENIKITDNHILLPSDRSGYTELYLYSITGELERQVTNSNYDVTFVYGYDESTGDTYYQAAGKGPLEREVYVTSKKGKTTCLTQEDGWSSAIFSSDYKYFIRIWSDCNTPYEFSLCNSSGKKLATLQDNASLKEKLKAYNFQKKEFFTFTTSEGVELNGVMIKPKDFTETKKYPVIMWQYGGPGSQQVKDSWSMGSLGQGCIFDEYLSQEGFIVVCVDGRGTGARGSEFEKSTYLKLGQEESKDQVEAAIYLGKLPFVDKDNIGIWGWSYGGFNCLMSMSEGRGVFKAGVAVAPPTNWKFYDSIYTERYMRTPNENPSGYGDNPISRVEKLHGKLLICQGLADDNVQPQNVFEYTEALVQADKDYNMNVFTNQNHSIAGGNARNHLIRQISNFFIENLK